MIKKRDPLLHRTSTDIPGRGPCYALMRAVARCADVRGVNVDELRYPSQDEPGRPRWSRVVEVHPALETIRSICTELKVRHFQLVPFWWDGAVCMPITMKEWRGLDLFQLWCDGDFVADRVVAVSAPGLDSLVATYQVSGGKNAWQRTADHLLNQNQKGTVKDFRALYEEEMGRPCVRRKNDEGEMCIEWGHDLIREDTIGTYLRRHRSKD